MVHFERDQKKRQEFSEFIELRPKATNEASFVQFFYVVGMLLFKILQMRQWYYSTCYCYEGYIWVHPSSSRGGGPGNLLNQCRLTQNKETHTVQMFQMRHATVQMFQMRHDTVQKRSKEAWFLATVAFEAIRCRNNKWGKWQFATFEALWTRRAFCVSVLWAKRCAERARSGGTPGPANVANSTRRGSEEGVNRKKITPGHVWCLFTPHLYIFVYLSTLETHTRSGYCHVEMWYSFNCVKPPRKSPTFNGGRNPT